MGGSQYHPRGRPPVSSTAASVIACGCPCGRVEPRRPSPRRPRRRVGRRGRRSVVLHPSAARGGRPRLAAASPLGTRDDRCCCAPPPVPPPPFPPQWVSMASPRVPSPGPSASRRTARVARLSRLALPHAAAAAGGAVWDAPAAGGGGCGPSAARLCHTVQAALLPQWRPSSGGSWDSAWGLEWLKDRLEVPALDGSNDATTAMAAAAASDGGILARRCAPRRGSSPPLTRTLRPPPTGCRPRWPMVTTRSGRAGRTSPWCTAGGATPTPTPTCRHTRAGGGSVRPLFFMEQRRPQPREPVVELQRHRRCVETVGRRGRGYLGARHDWWRTATLSYKCFAAAFRNVFVREREAPFGAAHLDCRVPVTADAVVQGLWPAVCQEGGRRVHVVQHARGAQGGVLFPHPPQPLLRRRSFSCSPFGRQCLSVSPFRGRGWG